MEIAVKKIGHRVVDAQHLQLFKLLEGLEEAKYDNSSHKNVKDALVALSDYVEHHFSSEESLMIKINYPYVEQHIRLHEELKDSVVRLKKELEEDPENLVLDMVRLLRKWLVEHINKADTDISKYLDK